MDKRGDVAIILLFVVALVLSVSALFIFASFGNNIENVSRNHNNVLESLDANYSVVIEESRIIARDVIVKCNLCSNEELKRDFTTLAEKREGKFGSNWNGNFFGRIRNGDFDFYRSGENYFLNVSELFVTGKKDYSSMKRNFNLTIEFDKEGKVIRFINK